MDLHSVQKAYSRWSHVYDVVFGPAFRAARRRAIGMLELGPGDRVLEVGVGTGLSFPFFPPDCRVIGVDISREMLARARDRAHGAGGGLIEGDVGHLPFAADVFDAVLAPFVVSAVPDPVAMLRQINRVTRPDARVVLLNHFASSNPVVNAVERAITKTTARSLGFHADFDVEPVLARAGWEVTSVQKVPPLGYWTALRVAEAS
jgi:phosphatidylethanolamine/phosphatidyl-N-methylethanolamine N-methyltransferase